MTDVALLSVLRAPQSACELDLAGWDLLLRQAVAANLTATLVYLFDDAGITGQVPAQARRHLEWARALAERHRRGVEYEVRQLQIALQPLGIPLVLLKGGAYAMGDLPLARGRLFSDIDILVPHKRLDQVEDALLRAGWVTTHDDPYDQRYYREWMHELPPMKHVRSQGMVDVHHAILPRTAPIQPDTAELMAAATPLGQSSLAVLSRADMVLHSAVHLFHDGEFDKGLRDLLDIHRLLEEFSGDAFWDRLLARAQVLGLGRPLYYALRYSQHLLGTAVPVEATACAAAWAPAWPLRWLMDRLFERALRPHHESCELPFSAAARFALYVRANWLRMPPLLLARHLLRKALIAPQSADAQRAVP